jgi:type IV pilus assembly protein PilA
MTTHIRKALATRRRELLDDETGFTLIELLVVVIVIVILAAIAVPVYLGAQASSKDASVKTDLSDIKLAVVGYYMDNTLATTPPTLDKTTLGKYGFSIGTSYTTTPVYKSGSTAALFCIDATSVSSAPFHVSTNSGTQPGACTATTTAW